MSLDKLAASVKTDVIPGFTLHPYDLKSIGQLQKHFEQKHLNKVALATMDLPEDLAAKMLDSAQSFIVNGNLHYRTKAFDMHVLDPDNLAFLLQLAISPSDNKMTEAKAAKLINDENRNKVHMACLEGLGWDFPKNEVTVATETPPIEITA